LIALDACVLKPKSGIYARLTASVRIFDSDRWQP
jgi:hypothetical protein